MIRSINIRLVLKRIIDGLPSYVFCNVLMVAVFSNAAYAIETALKINKSGGRFELIESISNKEYCSGLLDFTNTIYSNSSGLILPQLEWKSLASKYVKNLNGKVTRFYMQEGYLEIDVNGDNKIDTVMRRTLLLNARSFHSLHILDNKLIRDIDVIDMKDLIDEWMISLYTTL